MVGRRELESNETAKPRDKQLHKQLRINCACFLIKHLTNANYLFVYVVSQLKVVRIFDIQPESTWSTVQSSVHVAEQSVVGGLQSRWTSPNSVYVAFVVAMAATGSGGGGGGGAAGGAAAAAAAAVVAAGSGGGGGGGGGGGSGEPGEGFPVGFPIKGIVPLCDLHVHSGAALSPCLPLYDKKGLRVESGISPSNCINAQPLYLFWFFWSWEIVAAVPDDQKWKGGGWNAWNNYCTRTCLPRLETDPSLFSSDSVNYYMCQQQSRPPSHWRCCAPWDTYGTR